MAMWYICEDCEHSWEQAEPDDGMPVPCPECGGEHTMIE